MSAAWLGDWWAYGEAPYGERKAIVEAEDWESPVYQTCRNAATDTIGVQEDHDLGDDPLISPTRGDAGWAWSPKGHRRLTVFLAIRQK